MRITIDLAAPPDNGDDRAQSATVHGSDIEIAAQHVARSFPGGARALAEALGISPNTFQHKTNPNNTTHHLTLDEAVRMQQATGNAAILHAMADTLGYACTRVAQDVDGGNPLDTMLRLQTCVGDLMHAVADALRDGGAVTGNAMRRADYQAQELMAAIGSLLALLRSGMSTPAPAWEETARTPRQASAGAARTMQARDRDRGSSLGPSLGGNSRPVGGVDSERWRY